MTNEMVDVNSVIKSEAVDHFNSLIEEFRCYFPGVEYDTPVLASTRNPFRISVKEFANQQNEYEDILAEFLDMVHDSMSKLFLKIKAWKNFGK